MDNGKITVNISFDISKAFDTLDFKILLIKIEYYGIKGSAYNLLESYLIKHYKSKQVERISGVIQGSIFGPLLFCIYIYDLVISHETVSYSMYADDTILYLLYKIIYLMSLKKS